MIHDRNKEIRIGGQIAKLVLRNSFENRFYNLEFSDNLGLQNNNLSIDVEVCWSNTRKNEKNRW